VRVPVVQGFRYAIGVSVPFFGGFTGPFAALKSATEEQGFASLGAGSPGGQWLAENGWSNVIAYRRGRAPLAEPLSVGPYDYVLIGTRSGPDDYLDTEDPRWAGSLVWVEATSVPAGAQPRPGGETGGEPPWGLYALGAVAALGAVGVVVSLSGEAPRRNPAKRRRPGSGSDRERLKKALEKQADAWSRAEDNFGDNSIEAREEQRKYMAIRNRLATASG